MTGCLWQGGPADLAEAIATFDVDSVDPAECTKSAARFDRMEFRRRLPREIKRVLDQAPASRPEQVHAHQPRPGLRLARRGRTRRSV